MTNKTELLSVPRELLARITQMAMFTLPDADYKALTDILIAPAEDVRAVGDELVHQVRSYGSCCWEDIGGESLEVCRSQPEEYEIRTLYRHPQPPVVLPWRRKNGIDNPNYQLDQGWNACLDEFKRLNP